jgi:predicted dehydrogenase
MKVTRRSVVKGVVAGATAVAFPAVVSGRNLNSRLQVACVGVDGIATLDIGRVASHPAVKLVGFCDVDKNRFAKADQKFPGVRHFADYREMFATLGDGFDAVIVDTPDHAHAPVAVAAMQRR